MGIHVAVPLFDLILQAFALGLPAVAVPRTKESHIWARVDIAGHLTSGLLVASHCGCMNHPWVMDLGRRGSFGVCFLTLFSVKVETLYFHFNLCLKFI